MPLMYLFIKNRPSEINVSAEPDESDWFLQHQRLVKSVMATAAILGTLIYSPVSSYLAGRFGRQAAILIFMVLGVFCLGLLAKYFAAMPGSAATSKTVKPEPE